MISDLRLDPGILSKFRFGFIVISRVSGDEFELSGFYFVKFVFPRISVNYPAYKFKITIARNMGGFRSWPKGPRPPLLM